MTEPVGPRFSLSVGDGAGALLGLVAGDTAGGEAGAGYSAATQMAVIVSYHLLTHGDVEREKLATEVLELDGDGKEEPSVYRGLPAGMRRWMDSAGRGEAEHSSEPSLDPATWITPVGMWYRQRPDELVEAAMEVARLTHLDGPTAVMATATAGAVAASCFGQNGRDLMMAVNDVAVRAAAAVESAPLRYSGTDAIDDCLERLRRAVRLVNEPVPVLVSEMGDDPLGLVIVALTAAAPTVREAYRPIEATVIVGGSGAGAITGAVMGARVGRLLWPWTFPNETWFIALGHKLVTGDVDLSDLPQPYAVEQRIHYADAPSIF